MSAIPTLPCPGCGAHFAETDGPVHAYMTSSPACWAAYGAVLAREYSDAVYADVHRLGVDAYAVQHPGGRSRQAIQSVGLHLVRLCLFLERNLTAADANAAMLRAGKAKHEHVWLERPASLGAITVANVLAAEGVDAHNAMVRAWAESAWAAWYAHHPIVRRWADAA